MTTRLTKPVSRVVGTLVKDGSTWRPLVVTVHDTFISLRRLGTRREETVDLESAYFAAIKGRVFRAKMEKAKAKKARSKK